MKKQHLRPAGFLLGNFIAWIVLVIVLPFWAGSVSSVIASEQTAQAASFPFMPGERLVYHIRWGAVDAGEAVFEILPVTQLDKQPSRHFLLTVKTSSFVDVFYKVRDRFDAYTDICFTRSMRYSKRGKGHEKRDVLALFDWEKQTVRYSDFNRGRKPVNIPPGSFDPLSTFYKLRCLNLDQNSEITFPVTDGKKCFMGKAHVVGRETITCFNTAYDTYVVEPELTHFGGVFKKSHKPTLRLWITADERRLPVRIQSKVLVGSIIGELVSVTR